MNGKNSSALIRSQEILKNQAFLRGFLFSGPPRDSARGAHFGRATMDGGQRLACGLKAKRQKW
jgi:hypothetical protein